MKVEIDINKSGNIVLKTINNGSYLYGSYSRYKEFIRYVFKNRQDIKVNDKKNGTIKFNDGENEVEISNYLYNSNIELKKLITQAKRMYTLKKQEELRKKRVKRRCIFASSLILSTSTFVTSMIIKQNNYQMDINDSGIESYTDSVEEQVNPIDLVVDESDIINSDTPLQNDIVNESYEYNIDYGSRTNTEKFANAKANYYNIIKEISIEYGIDPNIMLAIATQESGVHDVNRSGPAMGLMQIELSVWNGKNISAYNHKTKSIETVNITKEKLKDVRFNIKIACMIFQDYLKRSNNNLEVAIQMYNYGPRNVLNTFRKYYNNPSLTLDDVLSDYDSGWLQARNNIKVGDKKYLEHVLSYVEDLDSILCYDSNNNEIKYSENVKCL